MLLVAVGWFANSIATSLTPQPSLDVFLSPATLGATSQVFAEGPTSGARYAVPEDRLLAETDGQKIFGGLGLMQTNSADESPHFAIAVCLAIENDEGPGAGDCTTLADFLREGTQLDNGTITVDWGPTGGARVSRE